MRVFAVRSMRSEDVPGVVELQRRCFPEPFPQELLWTAEHLRRHAELFGGGQFVAIDDEGGIVGSASNSLLSEERWLAREPWDATLGGPLFATFDPGGTTLYGADISVDPGWRRMGVGRALYDARFGLVRKLGLARYGTACRIPGLAEWRKESGGSADDYVQRVVARELADRTLTPLLQYGMSCLGTIEDYMQDEESCHAAALLEWRP